jgi:phosphate transport system protein
LEGATAAFLAHDRESACDVRRRDDLVDDVHADILDVVQAELERDHTSGERLRFLLCVLQIVPELERSGDLVAHIAGRASQPLTRDLPARSRGLLAEMGRIGADMWRGAADAYLDRDPLAADRLRRQDDELDDLHVRLTTDLGCAPLPVPVAIEMGLVARFYERLGDHAVNVARQIRRLTLAGGYSR